MELEKTLEELKNNRNMTLYNQKMSVVHHIEMENNVYREEVDELKKKNEKLSLATKEKLESLDILNQLKFFANRVNLAGDIFLRGGDKNNEISVRVLA